MQRGANALNNRAISPFFPSSPLVLVLAAARPHGGGVTVIVWQRCQPRRHFDATVRCTCKPNGAPTGDRVLAEMREVERICISVFSKTRANNPRPLHIALLRFQNSS